MNIYVIDGVATAFVAGLLTSPHCLAMCGPIGCAVLPMGKAGSGLTPAIAGYHAARVAAYALFGAVAQGVVGQIGVDGGARPSLSQLSSQLSPRRRGTGLNVGGAAGHGDAPTGAAVGWAAFTPRRPQQPAGV